MIVTAPTTLREHSQGSMQMKHRLLITLKVSLCLIPCAIAGAQENVTHDHGRGAHSGARLGTVTFPNSGAKTAQAPFDPAIARYALSVAEIFRVHGAR